MRDDVPGPDSVDLGLASAAVGQLPDVLRPDRPRVQDTGVGDDCGEPVLVACGLDHRGAAHAPARDCDAAAVHVGARPQPVHDRGHDVLPVGPVRDLALEQHRALAGPLEDQGVITALERCRTAKGEQVHILSVAAVVQNHGRPRRPRAVRGQEVPGRPGPVVRDADPLERRVEQPGHRIPGSLHAGVDAGLVGMLSGAEHEEQAQVVVGGRAQVGARR